MRRLVTTPNAQATPDPPPAAPPVAPGAGSDPAAPQGWPVFRLGFRPFYLGASAFAAVAVPLWLLMLLGHSSWHPAVPPLLWHAHEMLFGFAAAAIVGFLLTAGKAWTGLPTPRGPALAALAALWIAARVAALTGPSWVFAVLDLALLPIVAAVLGRVLLRAGNRRNLPLAGILLALSAANLLFHLSILRVIELPPLQPLLGGLALIVMIECVIAGRVVPLFTSNATPGLKLQVSQRLERTTLAVTAVALASWVVLPPSRATALLLALAAALHVARQWQWRPRVTRSRPILWVLHAGYVWIAIGLALLALAQAGTVTQAPGVHALGAGATGVLVMGMMTRTARGHTGRALTASRPEVLAYVLVFVAAVLRVIAPALAPRGSLHALVCSGIAWAAAFALYLGVHAPWLLAARRDGKDG